MKKKILILCTGNSCRSQIAEGYLRKFLQNKADIYSAGMEAHGVNSKAVAIMKEDGVDISMHTSKTIDQFKHDVFDIVLTVCDNASENCPYFPSSAHQIHHDFPDPAKATGTDEQVMRVFRNVRNRIREFCLTIRL